jgi:hypothetical protein
MHPIEKNVPFLRELLSGAWSFAAGKTPRQSAQPIVNYGIIA